MAERSWDEQDVERLAPLIAAEHGVDYAQISGTDYGRAEREQYRAEVRALLSKLDEEGRLRRADDHEEWGAELSAVPGSIYPCDDRSHAEWAVRQSGARRVMHRRVETWKPFDPGVPSGQTRLPPA